VSFVSRNKVLFSFPSRVSPFLDTKAQESRGKRVAELHPLRNLLTAREDHVERALHLRQLALELHLVLHFSSQAGEERVD
jgi:hypothetical protein